MAAARLKSSIDIKNCEKQRFWAQKLAPSVYGQRSMCGMGEKMWLVVVPATDCVSSIFCPVIPSKQPKNAKINQSKLFLGDFEFQNNQISQIMC